MKKIRLGIYISNPEYFLDGDYSYCFRVLDMDSEYTERNAEKLIKVKEFELEIDDTGVNKVIKQTVVNFDAEIERVKQRALDSITELEDKKQQLLALPQL